jgi:hypothetical protein
LSQTRRRKEAKRAARKDGASKETVPSTHRDGNGRTYLVVQRDGRGPAQGLTLSSPLFNDQWQNDVALGAAGTAHAILSEGHTRDQGAELGRKLMAGTSTIVDGVLALAADRPPACQAGCAHCCHQAVGVSAPEVFAIYDHLRATRTPAALVATERRIRAADDQTRGMTSAERLSPELPCPFLELENDRCSIYPVRPLPCRGANSLDARACERTLRDPAARAGYLAGTSPLPCYAEPIRAFHAVTAGMQLALEELHGLEVSPLELTAAMRIMIDEPVEVPAQWLAGKDPFLAARGGDITGNPLVDALIGRKADGGPSDPRSNPPAKPRPAR